jgi:hypothetical protein
MSSPVTIVMAAAISSFWSLLGRGASAGHLFRISHSTRSASVPVQLSERDRQLVQAASAILRDAEDRGTPLSQAALARQLRAQGLAIANERLASGCLRLPRDGDSP